MPSLTPPRKGTLLWVLPADNRVCTVQERSLGGETPAATTSGPEPICFNRAEDRLCS